MEIVLKLNVINIVVGAICIAFEPFFIVLVWVTEATLGERLMITLMFGCGIVFSIVELFKAIYWRIVVEDDCFTFRNRWNKESRYSYSDIIEITQKSRYYIIILADQCITVEYRAVPNCDYFLYVAARHGVKGVQHE